MRLLLFNLATDADDPVLGFAMRWANELARHCDYVDIITIRSGRVAVADNVHVYSVGQEKGYSQARRLAVFYGILIRLLLTRRYDACFAHMMPLFAVLAGPLLWLWRIPTTLWFTHKQISLRLRLALWFSRRVVSADATSFPIPTRKLRAIGHGIDTNFYQRTSHAEIVTPVQPIVIQVARLMDIKHQATLIRAAAQLNVKVVLVGDVLPGFPDTYKQSLIALAKDSHISEQVVFTGNLSREVVHDWYQRATIAVNLSPVGLFDKAALESMSCELPTIVSNPAFDHLLRPYAMQLRIETPHDVDGLAQRLRELLAMSPEKRAEIGAHLREGIVQSHSLHGLIQRLYQVIKTGEIA